MTRLNVCKLAGCRRLTPDRYCTPDHRDQAQAFTERRTRTPDHRTRTRTPHDEAAAYRTIYRTHQWRTLSAAIIDRDDRTCYYCGEGRLPGYGGRLIAAHLVATKQLYDNGGDPFDPDGIVCAHSNCAERNAPARRRATTNA